MPEDISFKHLILSTLVRVFSMRKSPALEYSLIKTYYDDKNHSVHYIRVRFGNYKDSTGLTITVIVNPVRDNAKVVATITRSSFATTFALEKSSILK